MKLEYLIIIIILYYFYETSLKNEMIEKKNKKFIDNNFLDINSIV